MYGKRSIFCLILLLNIYVNLVKLELVEDDDPGEPLFLSPYIAEGKIEEAKNLAKVDLTEFNEIAESYSGFLTVNKNLNSNLFFWYFKAYSNWETAPVVLWLQGGPGASSLFGLFTENGPFNIESATKITKRKFSWHLNHNLIYIDNPVGTGFSFTSGDEGYSNTQREIATNLYSAITQFFKLFPELKSNKFFVTGESYGGKYVPSIAYHIHTMNKNNDTTKINLKGIAIGNGLSDPIHQLNYGDYLYQLGLFDSNALAKAKEYEHEITTYISHNEYEKAYDTFNAFIGFDQSIPSLFKNVTGFETHYHFLRPVDDQTMIWLSKYIQGTAVRKAIHVGRSEFHDFGVRNKVLTHLKADIFKSVAQWISELLDHYPVVIYNGQLDIVCAYPMTINYLKKLKFSGQNEYMTAERKIWHVDNEIAGYIKVGGNLMEILVRDAGHMVPSDQPKWAFDIINRLTSGKKFV